MKKLFLLSLIVLSFITKGQDCYNGGTTTFHSEESVTAEATASLKENNLILMPYVMKEKEVRLIMKEKNNSEINRLLKKVRIAKTFQNIGFAAIPEALIGGGLIGAAAASNNGSIEQKSLGIGLVALSGVCLSSSLCLKMSSKKNYMKAIAKYNQLYN